MHGYFVDQRLYDEARLIADPFEWDRQKQKLVREKIDKERESRIRTSSKDLAKVKVNKRLAERLEHLESKLYRKRKSYENKEGDEAAVSEETSVFQDPRFKGLFSNPDFVVDETSTEFKLHNPSTKPNISGSVTVTERSGGKTAVEEDEESKIRGGPSDDEDNDEDESSSSEEGESRQQQQQGKKQPEMRISSSSYRKSGHDDRGYGVISKNQKQKQRRDKTFGSRVGEAGTLGRKPRVGAFGRNVGGDKEVTFVPRRAQKNHQQSSDAAGEGRVRGRNSTDRRSASGNVFRREGLGK
jgi:ribosome biogenesis protein ENP2